MQPLLLILCSMLIKHGQNIAFRSLQKRPRKLQDARRPPTWCQHVDNMGSKRSAKIGPRGIETWSREALRLESLPDLIMDPKQTRNGPQTDPKWTSNRSQIDTQSKIDRFRTGLQIDLRMTIHRLHIGSQIDFTITPRSITKPSLCLCYNIFSVERAL